VKQTKQELPPWSYKDIFVASLIGVVLLLFFAGSSDYSPYSYVNEASSPEECFARCMNHEGWDKGDTCERRCHR
jgi:hypothetical protein